VASGSAIEILRYVVLFIALGLLAPYAGCHIFTSSPRDKGEHVEEQTVESSERNKHNAQRTGRSGADTGSRGAPAQLDELQELLSE